jgi:hypothetical protein
VDDGVAGGDQEDVDRMMGTRTEEGWTGTIPRMLAAGGMHVKYIVASGDASEWAREALGGAVLGVPYDVAADMIPYGLKVEMPLQSVPEAPGMPVDTARIADLQAGREVMTRRKLLSMVMSEFDPLGLIGPVMVHSKIFLRELYQTDQMTGWDGAISPTAREQWISWITAMQSMAAVSFPRSTKPAGSLGRPGVAGFADASLSAFCATVYMVWTDQQGVIQSRLIMGKCRVTPLHGTTIPQAELQALVILLQLMRIVIQGLGFRPLWVQAFSDSTCTIAALKKSGAQLKPFFANRVAEANGLLAELSKMTEYLGAVGHVPGHDNPADIGTRGLASLADLGPGTLWQEGPAFLKVNREQWDLPKVNAGVVPDGECRMNPIRQVMSHSVTQGEGVVRVPANAWTVMLAQA